MERRPAKFPPPPTAQRLHRREQLRLVKRAQRDRDREAGLVVCKVKL